MDRIAEHLEIVSPSSMLGYICLAVFLYFLVPQRYRLVFSLATMVFVLTLGRMMSLGIAANMAKIASSGTFFLVLIAAMQSMKYRSRLPLSVCLGYPAVGILAIFYVANASDADWALVLRMQWLLLVFSALATASTIQKEQDLLRVLKGLFIGMSVSCLLTISAIIFDSGYQLGTGRFSPYNCNPNQIGVLFAVTAGLGSYFSIRESVPVKRIFYMTFTILALVQCFLSVSRGSFLVFSLLALPSIFAVFRKPIFAAFGTMVFAVAFIYMLSIAESARFDRLDGNVTSRTEHTLEVLVEVSERPWLGVAFDNELSAYDNGLNAHNAYVTMLYLGGGSLCIPLFGLQLYGHWKMFNVWSEKKRLPYDPHLIKVLLGLSLSLFLHGFINDMVYYPTYTWAFLNVFMVCLAVIMCQGQGIPRRRRSKRSSLRAEWPLAGVT